MYAAGHTKGHNGHEQRNAMVSYVNLLPSVDPADQMQTRWNKARKIIQHRCYVSYNPSVEMS